MFTNVRTLQVLYQRWTIDIVNCASKLQHPEKRLIGFVFSTTLRVIGACSMHRNTVFLVGIGLALALPNITGGFSLALS